MNRFVLMVTLLFMSSDCFADHLTVDVFTTTAMPIKHTVVLNPLPDHANVHYYSLDQLNNLQQAMNQTVKTIYEQNGQNGKKAAFRAVRLWIHRHRSEYLPLIQAIQQMERDHITNIPAIVFNHQYTVLGTVDVNNAYQIYFNEVSQHHD